MEDAGYVEHRAQSLPARSELPSCPVETCVEICGSKWRPLILRDLLVRPMRFNELQRSVGSVSSKVLTENLRELERAGIVSRRVYPEVPPHVEYCLTEMGQTLRPVIDAMRAWGERYQELAGQGVPA